MSEAEATVTVTDPVPVVETPVVSTPVVPTASEEYFRAKTTLTADTYVTPLKLKELLKGNGVTQTGSGIEVAVVDQGVHRTHEFFTVMRATVRRVGYRTEAMLGSAAPMDNGHGTAMTGTVVSIAPGSNVTTITGSSKKTESLKQYLTGVGSELESTFVHATRPLPRVISCSWSTKTALPDDLLEYIVANNIVMVFALGNKMWKTETATWEDEPNEIVRLYKDHPNFLIVGAYSYDFTARTFHVSTYANSGEFTVGGLSGDIETPHFLLLPTLPDSTKYDRLYSGGLNRTRDGVDSTGDGTRGDDGWIVMRGGTSSATAQIAGVVALMLQKKPTLTPREVKALLKFQATDNKLIDIAATLEGITITE